MINLIKNEFIKIIKKKSTYLALFIIIMFVLGTNLLYKYNPNDLVQYESYNIETDSIRILYNFFNEYEFLMIIILITIGAGIISDELNKGTIKEILITPNDRSKILISKYIALFLMVIFIFLFILVLQILFGIIVFKNVKIDPLISIYNYNIDKVQKINIYYYVLLMFLLRLPMFLILIELIIIFGTISANSILTSVFTMVLYSSTNIIQSIYINTKLKILKLLIQLYWNIPYLIFNKPIIKNVNLINSTYMCITYFITLLFISFLLFTKKEIKNI